MADASSDGVVGAAGTSQRRRGIRQGLFMLLLMLVLAPLFGIVAEFGFGMDPWPAGVAILLFGGGGLLRIAYALMFESKYPAALPAGAAPYTSGEPLFEAHHPQPSLYPQRDVSASEYTAPSTARPFKTNDLEPSSVTEPTTRLLEKER